MMYTFDVLIQTCLGFQTITPSLIWRKNVCIALGFLDDKCSTSVLPST